MGQNSKIEWTDNTANLWWGCTKVHQGCDNCYAEHLSDVRYKKGLWGKDAPRQIIKSTFGNLAKWQAQAAADGIKKRVFVGSMMDIFEKSMPLVDAKGQPIVPKPNATALWTANVRFRLFREIDLGYYPNLIFQLLTKRPSNINKMIPEEWKEKPPPNVWFGTSPVDQKTFMTLVPHLLKVKGNRFLSIEPQLGPIDFWHLSNPYKVMSGIHWIICGGESGPKKRDWKPVWGYEIASQCDILKIPFFMKQWDKVKAIPNDLMIRQIPEKMQLIQEANV